MWYIGNELDLPIPIARNYYGTYPDLASADAAVEAEAQLVKSLDAK